MDSFVCVRCLRFYVHRGRWGMPLPQLRLCEQRLPRVAEPAAPPPLTATPSPALKRGRRR